MSSEQAWKKLRNFVISIERASDDPVTYRVEASREPGGEAQAVFSLPVDDRDVELLLLKLERPRHAATRRAGKVPQPAQESVDFGRKMYNAVMSGEVRDLFTTARHEAERGGYGLRIQLRLNDAPELADLPWEFLHDGRGFVALSHETPLVRYLDLPDIPRAMAVSLPLRILVMISAPIDQVPLDVEQEKSRIESALAPLRESGLVEVDYVTDGRLGTLHQTLARAKASRRSYHVWHYIGHGAFDPVDQASVLAFCDDDGRSNYVVGFQLGTLMSNFPSLRVAVLNACEGARANRQDPFAGVAAALVDSGVSAVIGMQFPISDRAAINLSSAFYQALVSGLPVDVAITEARMSVFLMPNWSEWATPILYMRAPDGRIFDISSTVPWAAPPPRRAKAQGSKPPARLSGGLSRWAIGAIALIAVAAVLWGIFGQGLAGSLTGGPPATSGAQATPPGIGPTATIMLETQVAEVLPEDTEIIVPTDAPLVVTDIPAQIYALATLFDGDTSQSFDKYDIDARNTFFSMDEPTRASLFAETGLPPDGLGKLITVARGVYVALDDDSIDLLPAMIDGLNYYHTTGTGDMVADLELMNGALASMNAGDYATSQERFEQLLSKYPQSPNPSALYYLAQVKAKLGDVPGALEILEELSQLADHGMSTAPPNVAIRDRQLVTSDQVSSTIAKVICSDQTLAAGDLASLSYLATLVNKRGSSSAGFSLSWPTDDHRIIQRFGDHPEWYQSNGVPGHEGLDFPAREGDNIYAAAAGIVSEVRLDGDKFRELDASDQTRWSYSYGNQIRIRHSVGCGENQSAEYFTIYAQLLEVRVSPGDEVKAGDLIGLAGMTGNATGVHLHFVLKKTGATDLGETTFPRDFIDPEPFLP